MNKLRELTRLNLKQTELLILLIFLLLNLRVVNWFQPGYLVFGGDFRPPIVPSVFLQNALHSWNEVDWGVPSVYSPRMLDPFSFMMTAFQTVGASAFVAELTATYLIYVFVAVLVYMYIKRLTNGNILAAFIGALFFTSNLHLIVDREQTAIGFINLSLMILPSLVTFTEGIKRKSLGLMTASGFLFVLTYAAFPNYRASVLLLIAMLITLVAMYINRTPRTNLTGKLKLDLKFVKVSFELSLLRKYVKYFLVFFIAVLLASLWLIALVFSNIGSLLSALGTATNPSGAFGNRAYDVLRLIAEWSIYSEYEGSALVPYSSVYLYNPLMIILSYLPTILAFAAVFVSKSRKLAVFFGSLAIVFLLLTSGSSPLFAEIYAAIINAIPFLRAFRTSTNWIFLLILTFSILIGFCISGLYRRTRRYPLKILAVVLTIILFLTTTYPLITGEVTQNWLDLDTKGSYIPSYFNEAQNAMSDRYWTILLPLRNVYPIYNFTEGVLGVGNPHPIVFSKPFLSGTGTEYVQSPSLKLLAEVYGVILRGPAVLAIKAVGNASASSVENDRSALSPDSAIDVNYASRWASKTGMPQWYEIDWNQTQELSGIRIVFENAYANDYTIQTWNGVDWTTQVEVENNTLLKPEYTFPKSVFTTKLRLNFTKALPFDLVSIYEIEINPQKYYQTEAVPKLLGMLGIKNLLVENNMVEGNLSDVGDTWILRENNTISLVQEYEGASMYENAHANEKLYSASNILPFVSFSEMYKFINKTDWVVLENSAFVNSTTDVDWSLLESLQAPEGFSWQQLSPTRYEIHAESNAPFLLAFLENYDRQWKAFVDGKPIPESNHVTVNAFGNGWIVNSTGKLTMIVEYETQNLLTVSVAASITLSAVFALVVVRKNIRENARRLWRRIKES